MLRSSKVGISRIVVVAIVIVVIAVAAVGAYYYSTTTTTSTSKPKNVARIAVLLVGEENDLSWNQAIYQAAVQTAKNLNASGTYVHIDVVTGLVTSTQIIPAMQQYAQANYSIIIGGGVEDQSPAFQVMPSYPSVGFIIAGGYGSSPNEGNVLFRGDQSGFLMGVLAALESKTGTVSIIGGLDVSAIHWTTEGFLTGVKYANENFGKNVSVINTFVGNFDDPAASKSAAATAVAQGADVLFCSGDGITEGVAAEATQANVGFLYYEGNATSLAPKVTYGGTSFAWTPAFQGAISSWLSSKTFGSVPRYASLQNNGLIIGTSSLTSAANAKIISTLQTNIVNGKIQVYSELANGTLIFSPVTPTYSTLSG